MTTTTDLRLPQRTRMVLALLTLLAACGGGDGGTAPPAVTAVAISPGTVPLQGVGATATVSAALTPSTATGTITWTTGSPAIATVSGTGASATITAVGGGTTTVIAAVGGVSGTATVTVTPIVRSIAVAPAAANVAVGGTSRITATLTADPGASQALQWTSSAPTIATVDGTGNITGVAPGNATITVASTVSPSVTATVAVVVSYPVVNGITITPDAPTVLLGLTRQLTAAVNAAAGVSTAVTWTSSATGVATVSAAGLVTAVAIGNTTIRATSVANPTVSGTTIVTISAPTVRGITLTPTTAGITQGSTRQLTAVVDADAGANTALNWTSTDPTVAQVSATGLVTAVSPGTANVRATSVLVPGVFASSAITVTEPPPLTNWVAQASLPPASLLNYYMYGTYSLTNGTAWGVQWLNGNDRRMLRYDGTKWITTTDAPFGELYSIGGFGDNVWIGSVNGRLARLSIDAGGAQTWVTMNSPTTALIKRIIGTSATTAVAATYFRVMVLANGAWTLLSQDGTGAWDLADIAATANDNIAVVLYTAVAGSRVRRWNGTNWGVLPDPPIGGELYAVKFRGSDIVVSNNLNQSAVYDGTNWSMLTVPVSRTGTVGEFIGSMVNCNGQLYASTYVGGRVFRLAGTVWTTIADYGAAVAGSSNGDLSCGADNVLRSTGAAGGIGRYTGSAWVWEVGSPTIDRIIMLRPDLAWASGGYGMVRKWDGTRWTTEFSDATGDVENVTMRGLTATVDGTVMATRGAAPDQAGAIYRRQANGTWVTDNTSGHCEDVWATSSTFALAVGEGCGLRWNGSAWSTVTGLPTTAHSIGGTSPTFAIAVGQDGAVSASSRWDGTTWIPLTTPNVGALRAVRMASPTAAYALGETGSLRWDGTQWNVVPIPIELAGIPIRDISVNSATEVYVLTNGAALWRYDGTKATFQAQVSGAQGDAYQLGPRSLATMPGYGMIGTGAGTVLHATSVGAVRGGIAIEGLRLAPASGSVKARDAKNGPGSARRREPKN